MFAELFQSGTFWAILQVIVYAMYFALGVAAIASLLSLIAISAELDNSDRYNTSTTSEESNQ